MTVNSNRPYPKAVCLPCGLRLGFRSVGKDTPWVEGQCGVCAGKCNVTHPANFGHLRGSWNYSGMASTKNLPAVIETEAKEVTKAVVPIKNYRSAVKAGDYMAADEVAGRVA